MRVEDKKEEKEEMVDSLLPWRDHQNKKSPALVLLLLPIRWCIDFESHLVDLYILFYTFFYFPLVPSKKKERRWEKCRKQKRIYRSIPRVKFFSHFILWMIPV